MQKTIRVVVTLLSYAAFGIVLLIILTFSPYVRTNRQDYSDKDSAS